MTLGQTRDDAGMPVRQDPQQSSSSCSSNVFSPSTAPDPSMQRRVLSIQSHVVHGYVGNKCVVLPLQLHGIEVDSINSVQFSNHTGYPQFSGQVLDSDQLDHVFSGIRSNGFTYTHIMTGYIGSASFLNKVAEIVTYLKKQNPALVYFCDPVLGDQGQLYVDRSLIPVYQSKIVSIADVLTPNQFELEQLTGLPVDSELECLSAISRLFAISSARHIVVTSFSSQPNLPPNHGETLVAFAASREGSVYRYAFNRIPAQFFGTGDLFSALLLASLQTSAELHLAVLRTLSVLQTVVRHTFREAVTACKTNFPEDCASLELRLVQFRDKITSCDIDQSILVSIIQDNEFK